MANVNAFLQTFAGGEFGDAMAARVGIEAYQASCELMENFFPLAQGPMCRRPAMEYIDSFANSDLKGILKGFQFDVGQNYLLLITSSGIEFFLNDGKLTIPEITATISNGTFTNFTGWTDNSGSGSSAAASGGVMALTSNGATESKARTTFTANESDIHTLAFDVVNGPVSLRVGTSAGTGDLLDVMELRTGHHRLSFEATSGTRHIEFWHRGNSVKRVDNVSILPGPGYLIPSPWAEEDLRGIYTAQDGDRLFMFHRDYPPRVLERRGHRSWSLVFFEPTDGPFDTGDETIKLTPSAIHGETTLTASRALFTSDDVRRLVRLTHPGQAARLVAAGDAVYSDPIRITGVGRDRTFNITITGTFTANVTLERSVGNQNQFSNILVFTGAINNNYNDSYANADDETVATTNDDLFNFSGKTVGKGRLDNTTVFYRLAVYPGDYTSGTATCVMTCDSGGSTVGVARIVSFSSATSVGIEVIKGFSRAGATEIWDIGAWAPSEEYPNCVAFSLGRLWVARRRRLWASVSDDYFSFQDGSEADRSIDITLRSRSSEGVRWMRHLDFLCVGTRNEEYVIRPATVAEPIGPSNIDPGLMSEEGGAPIEAQVGGDSIIFVHRSGRRVYQFAHNPRALTDSSFISVDLNRLNYETTEDGVVNICIQQEPERRIFLVLKSGIMKTSLFRREEEIVAWSTFRTDGFVEDACVFPELDVDAVYFIVRRKVGENYVRMIERLTDELPLNDEDMVHLDSMLQTEISRPEAILTFDQWEAGETVTVQASQSVFTVADEGKILWADGGRILIDTYNSVFEVEGTILNSLTGEQDPNDEDATIPAAVPPGQWGIAEQVTSVSGLDHLEGETVLIWADKAFFGSAVVSGGSISLGDAASRVFVGKQVQSRWKSLKLAYSAQKGTAVLQQKNVLHMGFILRRTADGIKFGQNFKRMKELVLQSSSPIMESAAPFYTGEIHAPFNGFYETDPRITLRIDTPGPATIVGLIPNVQVNER